MHIMEQAYVEVAVIEIHTHMHARKHTRKIVCMPISGIREKLDFVEANS